MRNVLRLAAGDFKRLFSNIVSIIIVLGLVLLPSIFTWYNVLACWDVFGNTGNLKVAVANSDEGYQSDLVPLKVNIGDQVVSALRANDQMNWVFTDEEDAVDGAEAGRYYAAVVIPQSFSRDMMTFYSGDVEHARIVYYSNEKKNAIAPKVTGQGADQISAQVNRVFAETLSETALGISQALLDYMDDTDAGGALGKLAGSIAKSQCVAIFVNQLREKVGVMFGNPETTTGGRALKFYSSVRLDVRRTETLKQAGEVIGNRTRVKIVKNKVAPPFKEAEFDIMFGKGISKEGDILDLASNIDIVQKSGAWFAYNGEKIGQGRENAKQFLAQHPDIMKEIDTKVRMHYKIGEYADEPSEEVTEGNDNVADAE